MAENVGGAEVLIQTAPNREVTLKIDVINGYHVHAGRHDDLIDDYRCCNYLWEKPYQSTGITGSTLEVTLKTSKTGIIRWWNSLCAQHWNYAMHFKYHIELKSSSTKITKDLEYEF